MAFGLAVIVGNTIGIGILRTPGEIATHLPDRAWFLAVWLVGGGYALLGALTMAELGAMIPASGGQYVFARRALGDYAGFVVGWSDWLSTCGSLAAGALTIAEYSAVFLPGTAGYRPIVATAVIGFFTVLQWRGVHTGDVAQQIVSLLKTLALLSLAVAALVITVPPAEAPAPPPFPHGLSLAAALVLAFQGVLFTYDGWNGMLYFSGEVKDPGRDIPRAMAWGVVTIMAIYLVLNLTFLHLVPIGRMAGEPLVAATAAQALFGPAGDLVLRGIVIVSLLGFVNACLMMSSRVPFAMGEDRLLPTAFTRVNLGGTPTVATGVSVAIALAFAWTGTFEEVLALLAFYFVLNYALSWVSLLVLRRREPDTPRPYRAFGYPGVTVLLLVGASAFLAGNVVGDFGHARWSLLLLAASYPVFRLVARSRGGPS